MALGRGSKRWSKRRGDPLRRSLRRIPENVSELHVVPDDLDAHLARNLLTIFEMYRFDKGPVLLNGSFLDKSGLIQHRQIECSPIF